MTTVKGNLGQDPQSDEGGQQRAAGAILETPQWRKRLEGLRGPPGGSDSGPPAPRWRTAARSTRELARRNPVFAVALAAAVVPRLVAMLGYPAGDPLPDGLVRLPVGCSPPIAERDQPERLLDVPVAAPALPLACPGGRSPAPHGAGHGCDDLCPTQAVRVARLGSDPGGGPRAVRSSPVAARAACHGRRAGHDADGGGDGRCC